jgi:glycosyltransferase involved in cell wall biosynthesis
MNTKRNIILHITPHLGGGVGRVILNYLKKVKTNSSFLHKVVCLEYANQKSIDASRNDGFLLVDKMSSNHAGIKALIIDADIILVHRWNHPLLFDFLVRETLPAARVIFWSHISGFHLPYVYSRPSLEYPDVFVFTTPLSFECKEVEALSERQKKNLAVVWSTGGIEVVASVSKKPHDGYIVGYVGTVDYSKMHPDYLKMCNLINIPDVQFVICGGPSEKQLKEEASKYNCGKQFNFVGQVDDITPYLSTFDVFGYPLSPFHWGTCEQSLGECMSAGIPPVVFANKTECYIVKNGVTGIIASTEKDYIQGIEELYRNAELRKRLSENAKKTASELYSLDVMVQCWEKIFSDLLILCKRERKWSGKRQGINVKPHEVFLESLGSEGKDFEYSLSAAGKKEIINADDKIKSMSESNPLLRSVTRGAPGHYASFFPEDEILRHWVDVVNG